jgi:hypothetical protein
LNQWLKKRFFLLIACEVIVLFAIEFGVFTKHLSGRAVGILGLLNMAVFITAFVLVFRKAREKVFVEDALLSPPAATAAQAQRLKRGIKAYKQLMIMFAVFLVFGELVNGDSSASIRISGAVFDLGLIALFYWSMRRTQARLKRLGETI